MTRLELMRLAEDCSDIYTAMETDLMNNIAEYISQGNLDSPTAKWKIQMLAGLGKLDKANIKTIREWATIAPDAQEIALEDAALSAVKEMDKGFAKLAEQGILQGATVPMEDSAMQAMAMYSKQAVSRLNKVNTVMRYFAKNNAGALINNAAEIMSKQEKLDILNKATGKVVLGAESRQAAVRQCIKEMSAKGIPAFVDAAGRKWTPEAYINMDVRTTCNNVAHEAQFTRMEAYGIDLIEVSSHVGARPKCALDQGRIFDRKNKSEKYPHWKSSSYGEPDGILGINCGHHIYPFVEGVSTQSYFPYDEKENAEAYKQAQKQRQLEREVRTAKRECSMLERLGDEKGLAEAKARLKQKQDAYFGYCQKSGLKAKRDRLRVEDFDGVLKRKGIDNSGGSGIMKLGKTKNAAKQKAPDFSEYTISDDLKGVNAVKEILMSDRMGLSESNIHLEGIRNAEVLKPFVERLAKVKKEVDFNLMRIRAAEVIDGDERCIAAFKPYENTLYVSTKYFNSKKATLNILRDWANADVFPKQAKTIEYLAEHEAAHIYILDELLKSKEASEIWKKRKLTNDNDFNIYEYYADAAAIYRTTSKFDSNIQKAADYLIKKGVKL